MERESLISIGFPSRLDVGRELAKEAEQTAHVLFALSGDHCEMRDRRLEAVVPSVQVRKISGRLEGRAIPADEVLGEPRAIFVGGGDAHGSNGLDADAVTACLDRECARVADDQLICLHTPYD